MLIAISLCHLVRLFMSWVCNDAKKAMGLISILSFFPFFFKNAAAHHAVCILSESLQRQQWVVWLNNHITHLILVWEDWVSLYQLLWVPVGQKLYIICLYYTARKRNTRDQCRVCACGPVIEPLQEIGSKPRACPPSNRVTQDKSLQRQRITQYLQFQATACATHVRTLLWTLLKQNVKCACGCANASFPLQLYKWERSPTSQIGSLTPPRQPSNTCLLHSPGYYHQTYRTPHPANIHMPTAARPTFLSNAHTSAHTK